jgi:hypothetical protein
MHGPTDPLAVQTAPQRWFVDTALLTTPSKPPLVWLLPQ